MQITGYLNKTKNTVDAEKGKHSALLGKMMPSTGRPQTLQPLPKGLSHLLDAIRHCPNVSFPDINRNCSSLHNSFQIKQKKTIGEIVWRLEELSWQRRRHGMEG